MNPWQEKNLRVGDTVSDNAGERGTGVVTRLWPYGADINFERGESFLGFGWIEKETPLPSLDDIPEI